jgi:outer membrane protein TolC
VTAANLALAAQRAEITGAATRLGLERTYGLIPEVEAGATAEREPGGDWALGPVISLPIPLFNQGTADVAIAMAELRRSRAEYYAHAVELRAQVRTARALMQNAYSRATYYLDVVLPLRQQIVHQTQLQYNAMQIGVFELLHAKSEQVKAGIEYIEALREYWLARVMVQALLSGGMADVTEVTDQFVKIGD